MEITDSIAFDLQKNKSSMIKVIGVGGGGSNAVNFMSKKGIHGVDFVICNTDAQALEKSTVLNKIQLGGGLTGGLGAGSHPEVGRKAAEESEDAIEEALGMNTKMVFVTAGMGGGTGTGAAPVVAKIAKKMGILTVGIVTIPFENEGQERQLKAVEGLEELKKNVDSLIVINNNRLSEIYGKLGFRSGFAKANEVLLAAAKGIADVVTYHYMQNIDFNDVKTVLQDSGTAIMGSAIASGDDRAEKVIKEALNSPLLENNSIRGAKNVLLLMISGDEENDLTFEEMDQIRAYIRKEAEQDLNIIEGIGDMSELGEQISVTIVATGFNFSNNNKDVILEESSVKNITVTEEPIAKYFVKKEETEIQDANQEIINQIENSVDDFEFQIIDTTEEKEETLKQPEFDFNAPISSITEEKTETDKKQKVYINPESLENNVIEEKAPINTQIQTELKEDDGITLKVINESQEKLSEEELKNEINPMNSSIEKIKELKSLRNQQQIKDFNLKYHNVDKMEKEPAFKRHGVNIQRNEAEIIKSNTTISTDKNNEQQIRTNNSFLHDNVD